MSDIWYHSTQKRLLPKIMQEGLRVNSGSSGFSTAFTTDFFLEKYGGTWPIFLSEYPETFSYDNESYAYATGKVDGEGQQVCLRVDVEGLPLVADIPSLIDAGMEVDEDGMYWEEKHEPSWAREASEEGFFPFADLTDPDNSLVWDFIEWTHSAACMADIGPERIEVVDDPLVESVARGMG